MSASASSSPEFSTAAVEQLGDALRAYLWSPDERRRDGLREALERLCAEAHAAHLGPERMLVAVKAVWARMPGIEQIDHERARLALESVVGHCIEAYYGEPSAQDDRLRIAEERQQRRVVQRPTLDRIARDASNPSGVAQHESPR